jgi:hypothetical protein
MFGCNLRERERNETRIDDEKKDAGRRDADPYPRRPPMNGIGIPGLQINGRVGVHPRSIASCMAWRVADTTRRGA